MIPLDALCAMAQVTRRVARIIMRHRPRLRSEAFMATVPIVYTLTV